MKHYVTRSQIYLILRIGISQCLLIFALTAMNTLSCALPDYSPRFVNVLHLKLLCLSKQKVHVFATYQAVFFLSRSVFCNPVFKHPRQSTFVLPPNQWRPPAMVVLGAAEMWTVWGVLEDQVEKHRSRSFNNYAKDMGMEAFCNMYLWTFCKYRSVSVSSESFFSQLTADYKDLFVNVGLLLWQ